MTGKGTRRRAPGELETALLRALWEAGTALTPSQLQARVGPDLAYNTVHTVLTRMCDKGVLRRTQLAGRPAYLPVQAAEESGAARLHAVLEASDDHVALLRRFVATLTPADEAALRAVLDGDPDS